MRKSTNLIFAIVIALLLSCRVICFEDVFAKTRGRRIRSHKGKPHYTTTPPIHFSSSQKKATDAGIHTILESRTTGKGKGSKSSRKYGGSISSLSSSSSKSSSGKGKGSSKSSKKSSKLSASHSVPTTPTSHSPVNAPTAMSSADGDDRPPTPVGSPTRPPSSTECDSNVLLSAYAIEYTLEIAVGDIPSSDDNRDLAVVVDRYVSEFLTSQFSGSTTVFMTGANTLTGNLDFQTPTLVVDYDSRACFTQGSELPSVQTLDAALATMLSTQVEQDQFIFTINSLLPAGNIFKTSLVGVEFGGPPSASILDTGSGNSAAIASGAAGLIMLGAGLILYKRRPPAIDNDHSDVEKNLDKNNCGESTVAGDTFTGETYTSEPTSDGTESAACTTQQDDEYILPPDYTSPIHHSVDVKSPYSWNGGAIPRDEWKKDLIEESSFGVPEAPLFNKNHAMEKYDAFLDDSDDDDHLPSSLADPILSMYEEDIAIANESTEESSSKIDMKAEDSFSVDQIEAMLSYQI